MGFFEDRAKQLGVTTGVTTNSNDAFFEQRAKHFQQIDEYKQYGDQMKSAYQSNPESFNLPAIKTNKPVAKAAPQAKNSGWNGIIDNPIVRGIGKGLKAVDVLSQDIAKFATPDAPMFTKDGKLDPNMTARQQFMLDNPQKSTGSAGLDKTLDVGGQIGSLFVPMGTGGALINDISKGASTLLGTKLGAALEGAGGKLASKGANLLNPALNQAGINLSTNLANKAGQALVRGSAIGAGYGAVEPLAFGSGNISDIPKSIAENALMFGGGEAALPFAGAGLSAISKKLAGTKMGEAIGGFFNRGKSEVAATSNETLALPAASSESMAAYNKRNGNILPTNETPIYGKGDIYAPEPLGLPQGNYVKPTKLKVMGKEDTFNNVIPKIFTQATERMTPPLENETLLAKWVQGHLNDAGHDVSLNQVRELKYEDLRQLAEEMRPKINVQEVARKTAHDMGYGKIFDQTSPTIKEQIARDTQSQVYGVPAPKVGIQKPNFNVIHNADAAMPETKIKNIDIVRNAKAQPKISAEFPNASGSVKTEVKPMDTVQNVKSNLESASKQLNNIDYLQINDLKGVTGQTRDVYRNLEETLGKENAQPYIESLNAAKDSNIKLQTQLFDDLKTNVVDKLGIKKGSNLSALVQKYGEGTITLDQLKFMEPKKWQQVVEADKWFRSNYDKLIDQVNESRAKVYPNNPEKIVPKRKDYYRHFQDLDGLTGLKNLFETPAQISPTLEGISQYTQPRTKFAGFMQKRGLGPYKNDAVGGFLNYVPSAAQSIHIDPQISAFRGLAKDIAEVTDTTKNANKLVRFLNKYADSLAGKSHDIDRALMDVIPGGRKTMGVVNWISNRVKKNTILGNAGSLFAQLGNLPNGIAATKQYAVKGLGETMASIVGKNTTPVKDSPFLNERYFNTRQFDTKWFEQPLKAASWLIETADRIGTEFTWNSAYTKAVAEKAQDPLAYADDLTRKMVAGRGVGETPLIQQSKVFQLIAPFTLETGNAWRVMGGFVKEKDVTAIMTLFVTSYMFNQVAEKVRGSGVVFDPIQAMKEALQPGLNPAQRAGRLAGEVMSNVPLGDKLASIYPENGMSGLGTRKQLFGDNDPTRFGTGLLAAKGVFDPYKILPPFGGNQLKKTIAGVDAISKDGAYVGGKLKTPIDFNPIKAAQALTFGPNATKEVQTYYNLDRRPLSDKQTAQIEALPKADKQKAFDYFMKQRAMDSLKAQMKVISEDKKMSDEKKRKLWDEVTKKYQDLASSQ